MKINTNAKILLAILFMFTLWVIILTQLIYTFDKEYSNIIINTNNNVKTITNKEISNVFIDMAQVAMKEVAIDVAHSAGDYIAMNHKTRDELAIDDTFKNIAVRHIFERGYTAVVEPITHFTVAHPTLKYNGEYIHKFDGYDTDIYRPLLELIDTSSVDEYSSGFYKFISETGVYEDKFGYSVKIREKTKDGSTLIVIVTGFVSDFTKKSEHLNSLLNDNYKEASSLASKKGQWLASSITISILFICIIAMVFAYVFSKRISKQVAEIAGLTDDSKNNDLEEADTDINFFEAKSNDEVSEIREDVKKMKKSLDRHSDIILRQTTEVRENTFELEKLFRILEEKIKLLLSTKKK